MYNKIEKFLEQFPTDATSWVQATDEVRDLARASREMLDEYDDIRSRRLTSQQPGHQPSGTARQERQSSATTTLCAHAHNCSSSSDLKIGLTLKTQRYAPDKATKREPLQSRSEGTNNPSRRRGYPIRWQGRCD